MKIAAALLIGFVLGVGAMHLPFATGETADIHGNIMSLHGEYQTTETSAAMLLMQTDTALCEQPYFIEVYALSQEYFTTHGDRAETEEFSKIMFDHARNSGHFNAHEAEGWIEHIKDIPGQFVSIYKEDPDFLNSCYGFQVAAVGPPH